MVSDWFDRILSSSSGECASRKALVGSEEHLQCRRRHVVHNGDANTQCRGLSIALKGMSLRGNAFVSDGMDSSRDLNGIACQSRLASKIALEGGVR
jgi:hypothetical protein